MPKVVFTPSGRRGEFPEGTSLLDAARALGVDLDSVCGGRGICGRCQVTVGTGRFDKHGLTSDPDNAGPWTERETRFDAKKGLIKGRRLGCSAVVQGDMVVDVPPESQVHRPLVRKRADARPVAVDPIIHLHYVEVPEADLGTADGEAARIGARLVARGLDAAPDWDLAALRALQGALSKGKRAVTVAVHDRRGVIAVWPGFHERALGLAVDVGSTTIAAHLCDLADGAVLASAGAMNPQIRFGEDLMSRVSYAMMHPEGAGEMTAAVRAALNALAGDLCRDGGVDRTDILDMALVGNPVMHHLLLGLDPAPLGAAPFALAVDTALDIRATDLDLDLNPGARAYVLPCIAGHVGADAAAVALSEAPHRSDEPVLLIDVGTNAEIILGNRERLFAASSPTGPAFEGAQISAGQRAAPGAIERVRIDRETLEPRIRVIGCEAWSDEPGFAEGVAKTGVTGI
ncbi:MAG: DUF4445 domain-containing protein, partial [Rhodobacterales bacterium]|nr:DUF4445 domain-containing protein [Rhodobacterales bacterium]